MLFEQRIINGNKKLKEVYDIFLVEEIKQDTLTAA
jgi:hypothetical protein